MVFGFLLLFQITSVQQKMAQEFSKWLNLEYGLSVSSNTIKVGLFSGLVWQDVLLLDSKKDTLVFVEELKITSTDLTFKNFNRLYVEGLYMNAVYTDSIQDSEFYTNLKPFLKKSGRGSPLNIDHVWLNGADINFGNVLEIRRFSNLDLYLKEVVLATESSFVLSNLNWELANGQPHKLSVEKLNFSALETNIHGLNWVSGTSEIDFTLSHFSEEDSTSLALNTFNVNKNAVHGLFNSWPSSLELQLEGFVSLKGNRLHTNNFKASTTNGSFVNGALTIANIYEKNRWEYQVNAPTLKVDKQEWLWLEPLFEYNYVLKNLGNINASVSLMGTQSNVNLQMNLDSDQGGVSTDISINKPDSLALPYYDGHLGLTDFNLSALAPGRGLSKTNASLSVKGKGFDLKSFDTELIGEINTIDIGGYLYQNIHLNGRLQPNYFKGKALVNDTNLNIDFTGEIDFSTPKPVMDFTADILHANLGVLTGEDQASVTNLSSLLEMNLVGNKWDNIEGSVGVYFTTVETEDNYYHFNDLVFNSTKSTDGDTLTLHSDFANAQFDGEIDVPNLYNSFLAYLSPHFPLISGANSKDQNFKFSIDVFSSSALTDLFLPKLHLGDGARVNGVFNTKNEGLNFTFTSPNFGWENWLWRDLNLSSKATKDVWEIDLYGSKLDYDYQTKIEDIEIYQIGNNGDWRYTLAWSSNDSIKFDGIVKGIAKVGDSSLNFELDESSFYFADTLWTLNENSNFNYQTNGTVESSVILNTQNQLLDFNYTKNQLTDELNLFVSDFEFQNIDPWLTKSKTSLQGKLSGDIKVIDVLSKPKIYANSFSSNLDLNSYHFGDLELNTTYDIVSKTQLISGDVFKGVNKIVAIEGVYLSEKDSNNFQLGINVYDLNMGHLEHYLTSVFDEFSGSLNGDLNLYGSISSPEFEGHFMADNVFMSVPYLNINLGTLNDFEIELNENNISIFGLDFVGLENENNIGKGLLTGDILHDKFSNFELNLNLKSDSLLCLNTDAYRDESYYGKAIATGDASFNGPVNAIEINLNARTNKGTSLFIPLDDKETLEEMNFIHFIEKNETINDSIWAVSEVVKSESGLLIDMNLEVTEEAEVNIIFDETLGDKITSIGSGFINLGVSAAQEVYMYGDYTVSKGEYLFTLQNFVNKKFEIENGAKLLWDGNPYKAQMDLTALYQINTNINDLAPEYNRKTDVNCSMHMTGALLQPVISFDIQIPKGDDLINRILDERTNTEEKKTQQFLSLLVLNSFMSTDELQNTDVDYLSTTLSTGTEVLSNQLSNWMSQFTDRFDLGFKYHPNQGDTLSNKELELLLNNMKVNDRITFNGNIGTQSAQNTTRIIGDFKVEYQLKENGKLKLLAFRNLEESFRLQDDASNYTTGLGLYYRDEFDSFTDMWYRFKGLFRRRKTSEFTN